MDNNFLSEDALNGDWDQLSARIADAIAQVQELADAAKNITFSIQGIDTLNDLAERLTKVNAAIDAVNEATQDFTDSMNDLNSATKIYGDNMDGMVKKMADNTAQIQANTAEITRLTQALTDAGDTADDIKAKMAALTAQNSALADSYSDISSAANANTRTVQGQINTLAQLLTQMGQLQTASGGVGAQYQSLESVVESYKKVQKELNDEMKEGVDQAADFTKAAVKLGVSLYEKKPDWDALIDVMKDLYLWFNKLSDEEETAAIHAKEYKDTVEKLKIFESEAPVNIAVKADLTKAGLDQHLETLRSEKAGIDAKKDAYEELNAVMPQVLKNYTEEQVLAGEANKTIEVSIEKYSRLTAQINSKKQELPGLASTYETDKQELAKHDPGPNASDAEKESFDRNYSGLQDKVKKSGKAYNDANNDISAWQMELKNYTARVHKDAPAPPTHHTAKDPARSAKAEMEAQLRITEEMKKQKDEAAQQEYENSKKSYDDQYQLVRTKIDNEKEAWGQEYTIMQNFPGKIGETQNQELARLLAYQSKYDAAMTGGVVATKKIDAELDAERKKNADADKAYIAQLEQGKAKIAAANDKLDDVKARHAIAMNGAGKLDIFGNRERKNQEALANYDISQKQDKVRQDNAAEATLSQTATAADQKVAADEKVPESQRSEQQRQQLSDDKKSQSAAHTALDNQKAATVDDTTAATAAVDKKQEEQEKEKQEKQKQGLKDVANMTVQLAQTTAAAVQQIRDNQFAKEQMQLQIQMRMVQLQSQQQIAAINASVGYQIQKENEASKVVAQTTAKENQIQQQQNQLAIKKAIADKKAAEMGILLKTALAIASTLPLFADPATAAIGAVEVALITAMGAAEYAAASSAPIPQFYTGGTTRTPLFSAGERGIELIQPPNKPAYFSTSTPAIYHEAPGTRITAHEQTMNIIRMAETNVAQQRAPEKPKQDMMKEVAAEVAKIIGSKFEEVGGGLAYVISRSKPSIHITSSRSNERWDVGGK